MIFAWNVSPRGSPNATYLGALALEQVNYCLVVSGFQFLGKYDKIFGDLKIIFLDRKNWCTDALSLDTVLRIMPDERTMSKNDLIDHIKNYGCIVSCSYIAYKPM